MGDMRTERESLVSMRLSVGVAVGVGNGTGFVCCFGGEEKRLFRPGRFAGNVGRVFSWNRIEGVCGLEGARLAGGGTLL